MKLNQTQIDEFFERGWLVMPELFSESEVAPLREAFVRLHTLAQKLRTTQSYENALFVLSEKNPPQVIVQRIVWAGGPEKVLEKVSEDPRFLGPVSQLLGSKEVDQLLNQAHFKMPFDGVTFDWHQDIQHRDKGDTWKDLNGKGSYVQSLLLIDDMTLENGPLQFIPSSAKLGRVDLGGDGYDITTDPNLTSQYVDPRNAVSVCGSAGSVIFFGPYTIHGSFENLSPQPRRVLINGYAYPGANARVYPGVGLGRRLKCP